MKSIHIYSDSQHSWAKVKKQLLIELGIAEEITPFSHQLGEYAYLEEDQDMGTFLKAFFGGKIPDQWWNELPVKKHYSQHSKIRTYPQYRSKLDIKLEEGMHFKLYGKIYKAVVCDSFGWFINEIESGKNYRLSKQQLSEILPV